MPLLTPVAHCVRQRGAIPAGKGYPPFAGPVVRFHRLPAKLFARQAKQVADRMQTSMQLSRGGINFHLHFTEGKGLRQNMQHPFAAHSHRLNHLPGNPSTVRRLTAPLRVKQRPIQFDGVTAIRFCSAGDDLARPSVASLV